MATSPDRLHALDAARAGALLLGLVLHATMSFFLPVPARDGSQSATLAVVFFVIHTFRMSLFFLIAGYFAHRLLQSRGVRGFVKDRARRIVVPMTVGWILLAPPTIAILLWGLARTFADAAPAADAGAPAMPGLPLTHLWFLYYLCLFYGVALAVRAVAGGAIARIDASVRVALAYGLAPLLLALPLFAVLATDAAWPLWFGIPTPDTGLAPQLPALAGFGTAFAFGWLLQRQPEGLAGLRRQWAVHLALAIGLSVVCLLWVGTTPAADPTILAGPAWHRFAYAAAYTVSIWCWVFGLLGAALRFCATESPARRYLADASYWYYLVHLPIVFGLQVLLMDWPLHWTLKFPLILAVTFAACFASWHWGVRRTFVGELLGGRRAPRAVATAESATPAAAATAVAQLTGVRKRYGDTLALDALTFAVQPRELLALLGPNGAGKTTAIGLWLGTLAADAGQVQLLGGAPSDVQSRLGIGVMMQDVGLAPMLSAREHIALAASCYRAPLSVAETVALTGIEAFADKRYGRLSGGQKRQVQFAIAVCGQPRLLFLDEPTVGLDVPAREAMWRTLRALVAGGCAVVLTTHYLEEAEALADRVVVLAQGRLVATGSVDDMRALVTRKHIRCASTLDVAQIRGWAGVVDAVRETRLVHVTASDAEAVVQRLFAADPGLGQLEVKQASLAEALTQLTKEAA